MDRALKALADPIRREILRSLRAGDLSAGEIAARLPITAPSVSHHLNVLQETKLVTAERQGRHIIYSLNATVFQELMQNLMDYLGTGRKA